MILKKLLSVALVAALVVSGSLPALAFPSDDYSFTSQVVDFPQNTIDGYGNGCVLTVTYSFGFEIVNVNIDVPGGGIYYPGGSIWQDGRISYGQELTREILALCLGVEAAQITLIYSYGAGDPHDSDYSADTIVGFAFSVNDTVSWQEPNNGPSRELQANTSYAFQVEADGINLFEASNTDATAPTLVSSTPADDATGVAVGSNIVLTFSEAVDTETGSIVIKKVSDNSTVETFDVATSTAISGSGTTTITINPTSDLASSTDYYIEIDATAFDDAAGNSYAGISGATALNFTTAAPANTAPVANAGADQTVASGSAVTLDGSGSSDADSDALTYTWSQTSGTSVTLSSDTAAQPTFTAPTLAVGDGDAVLVFSLTVSDGTTSSSADTVTITVEAPSPTPATAFADNEEDIREVIQAEAGRSLRSTVSANQRMVHDARTRFIECGQVTDEDGCFGSRNEVAFDVDGSFVLRDETLSTSGTFFQQTGNYEGTQRRLFFGDFDVQHDGDTGSTTATLTGRMAWEQMVSDRTMLGYFIGGELAYSNIDGAFEGDQDRIGATIGAYAVHQLAEQVYLDGFLTVGAGHNNLEMANDVLALESDYTTRTATIGAALSGVHDYGSYEFRPELALTYGRTWIGNVDFTGRAYGLVDDTLSLDAGDVSIGTLILRPEVVWGLDADTLAESHTRFSFAPRLICESVDAGAVREDCGGGVELGLSSVSEDGLSEFTARVLADRIGNSNRSSFAINLEHRF